MTRRREWAALAALVLLSTAFRAWAAVEVPVPWIAPDEMVYGMLGRSLWLHGSLAILGGPTPYYSLLTPLLAGFPLAAFGLGTGYDLLQGLQAFVMSLAAVPVYLWARTLVSRRSALAAAALTLATPVLAYSGLVMTEVLFYPLLVTPRGRGRRRSRGRPAPPTSCSWPRSSRSARPASRRSCSCRRSSRPRCSTRGSPARGGASGASCPAAAASPSCWPGGPSGVWRPGKGALGGYEVVASTSYSVGAAARFVLYHGASLLILCGLFPLAAVAPSSSSRGFGGASRTSGCAPTWRSRPRCAVWVVVEVGVFASRYSDRIVERNLIGLAPVLFIGLVLWLARGAGRRLRGSRRGRRGALAVLLLLPVRRYVERLRDARRADADPDVQALHGDVALDDGLASTGRWRWRRRPCSRSCHGARLRWVPFALIVALVAASVVSSRFVVDEARAQQRAFLGDDPSWADHAGGSRIAYLYDGEPSWPGVWETVFWNSRIDRVYDLASRPCPGRCRRTTWRCARTGRWWDRPRTGEDEVRDRLELDQAARRAEG